MKMMRYLNCFQLKTEQLTLGIPINITKKYLVGDSKYNAYISVIIIVKSNSDNYNYYTMLMLSQF